MPRVLQGGTLLIERVEALDLRAQGRRAHIVVGTFDGVHRGHAALLEAARRRAHAVGALAVAFTFQNHPRSIVAPDRAPRLLTPWPRKAELIAALGTDVIVGLPFTEEFSRTSPEEFVEELLWRRCCAAEVSSGADFRFGRGGAGGPPLLARMAQELGFRYVPADVVEEGDRAVSSTRIREALAAGRVEDAAVLLGRPHRVEGIVERGDGLGRRIGFPTANIRVATDLLLPADGVYAGHARWGDGACAPAMLNIGWRPTVGGRDHRVEAHVLDVDRDFVGAPLAIDLCARLRDEQRFPGLDALVAQLHRDREAARAALR
jgi:riboflavin kinase/FMN adenylyltransferase